MMGGIGGAAFSLVVACAHTSAPAPASQQAAPAGCDERADTLEACRSACKRGSVPACINVGISYELGNGVPKDERAARAIVEPACASGYAYACSRLGEITHDAAQAAVLYRRGCDAGDGMGCGDLAGAYEKGQGVPKDGQAAVRLYERACATVPGFCIFLGKMFEEGDVVPVDLARAATAYGHACASDEPLDELGCKYLGLMYLEGRGVRADRARAVQLLRRACERGVHSGCDDLRELGESP
jgi:TPR repeat protein